MIKIKFREISRYHQNSPCTSRLKNPIIHRHFRTYHLAQPRETFQSPFREENPCQNTHNKKKRETKYPKCTSVSQEGEKNPPLSTLFPFKESRVKRPSSVLGRLVAAISTPSRSSLVDKRG